MVLLLLISFYFMFCFMLVVGQLSPAPTTPGSMDDDDDFLNNKKKQKRGVLPKHATSVMRSWLFQHLVVSLIACKLLPVYCLHNYIIGNTNIDLNYNVHLDGVQ